VLDGVFHQRLQQQRLQQAGGKVALPVRGSSCPLHLQALAKAHLLRSAR
jgi:hypothetical protein